MPEVPGVVENVRVVVRIRPMNEKEIAAGYMCVADADRFNNSITVKNMHGFAGEPPKSYTFDCVFGTDSKQVDIYNEIARPIVDNVLQGYNGTIFAYGQTGTGKTFTMEGDRNFPELKGIIPNSFAHIFGYISKAEDDKKFLVRVSYLEIYNEDVHDLLSRKKQGFLEVKERPDIGVYVKDLSSYVVHMPEDMDKIMTVGNKNRAVGATNMNAHSSRSHAIFTITIECSEKGSDRQQHVRMGKLHLVDLAGSERQSKTGATGQRLKEATKINLSLSTLGNVISSLVDGKCTHIPYRNSKLTRLLQDSLGGNAKTIMCANIGPADYNYDESISTLRYANRAKDIKNHARINEDPKDALLRQFEKEIKELRRQLEEGVGSTSEEEVSDSDGEEKPTKKKERKKKIPNDQIEELKEKIENHKKQLSEEVDLKDEERNRITKEIEVNENELQRVQSEHKMMQDKLSTLERKIIVGGVNLLDKALEQEKLLEESAIELEDRIKKEDKIREQLQKKEAERVHIEERYSNLQEEIQGKTKKYRRTWTMLQAAKAELKDCRQEHQREMEGLLESVRVLNRELTVQSLVIDRYIPQEYQDQITEHCHWNEDIGEWQLKCIAYTGNNMRKESQHVVDNKTEKEIVDPDLSHVYLSYDHEPASRSSRPKTSRHKSARPRSSSGVRPKSSKR